MSDAIKHIDVDSEEFEDTPRALREYVKKLQSQNTNLAKERDEAKGLVTNRAVADVLAGKQFKNPDRVKSALLSDGIDPLDTDKVNEWLAANEDDYAKEPAQSGEAGQEQGVTPATPVSAEQQAGYQNLQGVQGSAAANEDKFAKVQKLITPEMNGDQVKQLYREHGI